jgi:DMSO/TMAO reductase YedYZ molybdopterin-dependent catalytic subunit
LPASPVLGCLVRFNKNLMAGTSIPFSFECVVEESIDTYGDVVRVAESAASYLSDLLGLHLELGNKVHWEFIGRRFNLYAYELLGGGTSIGELRVIENGGYVINISGVLVDGIVNRVEGDLADELLNKRVISKGYTMKTVFLEPLSMELKPSGQVVVPRFIVYAAEGIPSVKPETWRLRIRGAVNEETVLGYQELAKRARSLGEKDFHCVTGWSVKSKQWHGVPLAELLEEAGVRPGAKWLGARSISGYASIVPLEIALREGIVATHVDGKSLTRENGFPARLFFPSLYGWKAVKWVQEIILLEDYEDGYWESLSYHERGLVSSEERFKIRNPAIARYRRLVGESRKLPPES